MKNHFIVVKFVAGLVWVEKKFQENPKKFYFYSILFFAIIFSLNIFIDEISSQLGKSQTTNTTSRYKIVYSTNLLNINPEELKNKTVVFRPPLPKLSKEDFSKNLKSLEVFSPNTDFTNLLIQSELGFNNLKKTKQRYHLILTELFNKHRVFETDDKYLINGLKNNIEKNANPSP